ncbi:MAG: DUF2333 family protein [Alphaproteobacteria bacterium]
MLNENIKKTLKEKYDYYHTKYLQKIKLSTAFLFALCFIIFLILYYGLLGGVFNSTIRKDVDIKFKSVKGLSTLGVASYVIDSEVQDNLWTPSLPFFFPTYFLDNLPSFQLGEMKAVSIIITSLSELAKEDKKLKKSADLLNYDGTIWMFDKGGVLPVPSSASQYKKGRQLLIKSSPLENGLVLYDDSLLHLLKKISKSLSYSLKSLDTSIIENEKTDNQFYYNQGKVYVYSLFLKAISVDYKDILVANDLYADITYVIKALEDGVHISPSVVKNADKSSSSANHLYNMGYYIQKALIKLNKMQRGLSN